MGELKPIDYTFFAGFLKERSGIILGADRLYFIENRLRPIIEEFKLESVLALINELRNGRNDQIIAATINAMTTNETLFFRDKGPFEILKRELVPKFQSNVSQRNRIRIWCAACSSGQEPYSVAMTLMESLKDYESWDIQILATDINKTVVDKAAKGEYTEFEIKRGVDPIRLQRYFEKTETGYRIVDSVKRLVKFETCNLLNVDRGNEIYDIVYCRNVIIYFDPPTKMKVISNVTKYLKPNGHLFLGGAEIPYGEDHGLERNLLDIGTVYKKAG